jgi:hypothetical protein
LDENVISSGDHELSGFFGCGVHPG